MSEVTPTAVETIETATDKAIDAVTETVEAVAKPVEAVAEQAPIAIKAEAGVTYKTEFVATLKDTDLTGTPQNVEAAQRALGFIGNDDTDDLFSHSAMARLCNERHLRWSHVNTMLSARSSARMIRFELV